MVSELYLLGTGCAIPQGKRGGPGVLLKNYIKNYSVPEMFLFDLGRGVMDKLSNLGIDYCQIGYLFFSHYHPDHTAELVSLLFAYRDPVFGRKEKEFFIFGPPGLLDFYEGLTKIYGSSVKAENYPLILKEVREDEVSTLGSKIVVREVDHSGASVGYRIKLGNGKVIVYSGDTGYSEKIVNLAQDADLLILECALSEEKEKPDHLTPSLAGKISEEARVKKLILTHFYPVFAGINIYERCQKFYSGEIVVAEDLMKFAL